MKFGELLKQWPSDNFSQSLTSTVMIPIWQRMWSFGIQPALRPQPQAGPTSDDRIQLIQLVEVIGENKLSSISKTAGGVLALRLNDQL